VLKAERGFSTNFIISHREGEAIDLEATPDQVFWLTPEDDLLVHANHFVSIPARSLVRDLSLLTSADSLYRDKRVRRYLAGIGAESRSQRFRQRSRIASARRAPSVAPHPGKIDLDGRDRHHGHDRPDHVGFPAPLRAPQVHRVSTPVVPSSAVRQQEPP
jgi:hypothetical protein